MDFEFWILDLLIFLRFEISKHLFEDNGESGSDAPVRLAVSAGRGEF